MDGRQDAGENCGGCHHSNTCKGVHQRTYATHLQSYMLTLLLTSINSILNLRSRLPTTRAVVPLTPEDKQMIYKPWRLSVIVKTFGQSMGYRYVLEKLNEIWQTTEPLNIIHLGKDYFRIRFHKPENYSKALHQGPWFVGIYVLAISQWQPKFTSSSTNFTSTAI